MNVSDTIKARRSIRKYRRKAIPPELLNKMLDAARLAPSSNNLQEWNVVVVTDDALKAMLVPASGNQGFVGECSAYLVGVAATDYNAIDISIAFDHISLQAVALGLGTCWIGDFDPDQLKKILGIPEHLKVHICMTLGYPDEAPSASRRKSLDRIFFKDQWGRNWG